jgi:LacI family transcriptional regulator
MIVDLMPRRRTENVLGRGNQWSLATLHEAAGVRLGRTRHLPRKECRLRHTLKDVAKHAGVSAGTVSRVLNDNPQVSPEMRARVEAAIADLGYRPNALARSFRRQRNHTLSLVVPDITEPFFAELAQHVGAEALKNGYSLVLGNSAHSQETERTFVQALNERRVDGLLLVPTSAADPVPNSARPRVLVIDRELPGLDVVASDHLGGVNVAIEYLFELGHRLIGYIAGPQDLPPLRQRYAGYASRVREILSQLGLKPDRYVRTGPYVYEFGYEAAVSLLQETTPRPTALMASSDQQAIGALRACADLGVDVPGDVSIVGFDDIPLASLVTPRLTTVRQPIDDIATVAVERLLERLDAPNRRRRRILLGTELVVRASCAPPQAAGAASERYAVAATSPVSDQEGAT